MTEPNGALVRKQRHIATAGNKESVRSSEIHDSRTVQVRIAVLSVNALSLTRAVVLNWLNCSVLCDCRKIV